MAGAADTFQQWDLDDSQALRFELSAAADVARPIRKAIAALTATLVAMGARYADPQTGQIPPDRRAQIRAALDAALAALMLDLAAQTARAVAAASALALRQETALLRGLGVNTRGLTVRLGDPVLADAGPSTNRVLAAAISDAQRFAAADPLATVADIDAAVAKAGSIAPRVEANVRFLTNRAINETTRELVREASPLTPPATPPAVRTTIAEGTPAPPGPADRFGEPPLSSNERSPLVDRGLRVVWVAERDACLTCLALSGHVIDPNSGDGFDEDATFGPHRPTPVWPPGMPLMAPPRHPNCRCRLRVITADNVLVPEALRREAERSVARGWSGYDSRRARLRAADRLIARANRLPRTVQERAARDVARGQFSDRHKPRSGLRAG